VRRKRCGLPVTPPPANRAAAKRTLFACWSDLRSAIRVRRKRCGLPVTPPLAISPALRAALGHQNAARARHFASLGGSTLSSRRVPRTPQRSYRSRRDRCSLQRCGRVRFAAARSPDGAGDGHRPCCAGGIRPTQKLPSVAGSRRMASAARTVAVQPPATGRSSGRGLRRWGCVGAVQAFARQCRAAEGAKMTRFPEAFS
jgi:hypothetical protein